MLDDPVLVNDWHPIVPSDSLKAGDVAGARLLGEDIVLWRNGGDVLAWRDLCIHRGTRLSLGRVEDDRLVCPYHGWTYDKTGQCVHIPAHPDQTPPKKATVQQYRAVERYNFIWVSLGNPDHDVAHFPEWDNEEYRIILCGPYEFDASAPRAIENFLDIAHFPFVHAGILGDAGRPEITDYEAEIGPDGVTARNVTVYQPDPYGTGEGDIVNYTYRVFRPLTAYLRKQSEGPQFSIFFAVTPHEEVGSTGWMWMAMNYAHDTPAEELKGWQDEIAAQDIPIVNSQRPELLPLDLQAELHLRSDRTAIAYRKWLNQLGLSFGTS